MRSGELIKSLSTTVFVHVLTLGLLAGIASPAAFAVGELSLPQWEDLFNPDGSHKDELDEFSMPVAGGNGTPDYLDLGALDAVFISDNISDNLATDMSARLGAPALAEDLVYNDTIPAPHDVGNVYVVASLDSNGDLQLYAGVELLSPLEGEPPTDSYVEIEFNLDRVRVRSGNPWPIRGRRSAGDLLVRLNYVAGVLVSAEFKRWNQETGFQAIFTETIPAGNEEACQGGVTPYVVCTGSPPLDPPAEGNEVWDLDGNPVASTPPDGLVELGLDITALLGSSPEFTSISVRTPEDIALGAFGAMGFWSGDER